MSDALWAARLGDALTHTSMMADILGGVLEVAANVAITALATAAVAAAIGVTVATAGIGGCILGAVVGIVVGMAMSKTGADKGLSKMCEDFSNALFPPVVEATIAVGSTNTFVNSIPAARAAGSIPSHVAPAGTELEQAPPEPDSMPQAEPGFLDMAEGFFSQLWRPTVATPAPGVVPALTDMVLCARHPPMPPQLLAEGSDKVTINGQPAVRSGDRSMCDATVVSSGLISPNVTIGGGTVVVQEIRSGKTPGVGLAIEALMMLKGAKGKALSDLPCMLLSGVSSYAVSQAMGAAANATMGSPNPVHAATGAKVLGGDTELDFVLPGILPIDWQRFYNSRDERRDGMFGAGWSVSYEVSVEILAHPDGGEELIYTDEQGRRINLGSVALGSAMFSPGEGLSVRRHRNGQLLIERDDGLYRLFDPTPTARSVLRLSQLGDRNDNRIFLEYDPQGRLVGLRDTFTLVQIELVRELDRVIRVERIHSDQRRETLASYSYDLNGSLATVTDATGHVQRRFAYDAGLRMTEHQLPTGLRCFYDWGLVEGREWRVVRHWTDEGDEYRFDYDLSAGVTRITDNLQRVSMRLWNLQHQIISSTDNLGQTWRFEWNDERQMLSATDPQGGRYSFNYDETGNLISEQDPLGRIDSTLWLAHWALPLIQTDPAGNSWHYRYDARGNCICATDPLGHSTHYRYDVHGQVVEIVDAMGKSKKLRWSSLGQLIEHIDCSGYPTRLSYDSRGYLAVIADASGERTQFGHDPRGRLLMTQFPDGRTEHLQRDASGQLVNYIDTAGHTTLYQHNRRGQVRLRIDAHGRQVQFGYDAYGRLQTLANENGESYRFAWDDGDRLAEQYNLDGSSKRYEYDSLNNIVTVSLVPAPYGNRLDLMPSTPTAPLVYQLSRDAVGRLTQKETVDGITDYTYAPTDQLVAATFTDRHGRRQELTFAYNGLGQLLKEASHSGTLEHHYDELGNLIQTQLPDGRWLSRLRYGSGHLHQINLDGQVITDFERDRLHREVLRTQGQISTCSEYDRNGRLRSRSRQQTGPLYRRPGAIQKHFEYDPADNLVGKLDQHLSGQHRQLFHYDSTGRIIASQDSTDGQQETFAYDAAANLLDGPDAGTGFVVHNQVITYQDKRYRYDGWGRMIEKRSGRHGVQRFRYDAENRLIEVLNERGHTVTMTYDPLGRRIEKAERDHKGHLLGNTCFIWDAAQLLQEHRHQQTSLYIYGDSGYEALARVDGTGPLQKVRYYHSDLNGMPELLTEADGSSVWQAHYRVWGNTLKEVREPYYIEEQNLRFQGQYLDRETGLHYNTFRFYDPDIGRFATPDPIGLSGGLNLYTYAPNPFGWIDPWGWSCWSTSRKKFWKEEATNNASRYSKNNLARMKDGLAPQMKVEVVNRKTGAVEERVVSMELHHRDIPQRTGGTGVHDSKNLDALTPWDHEAADPYRHTGYDLSKIITGIDKW
ncbi:RHS domain-containing protein [Pseudomonas fluorescens]|uniref:RHS repeat-associated core domain-containing protein n=1 Tax=Pseudomonas TaxID=286 RepID=UPI001783BAB1|nr:MULTISPECIES: RHS repeat-associated core domain-containing protein [Pseudomonas]MBD8191058.1 RHS domain-containing protein [Pseudomonas fluorescens]MBD8225955.1 RHS domain-containing protein [Pseudomonas fluorescens]MBD8236308.1 RHS domain-containing protein [Pseudomonas fluorescens]MBD8782807.1 RHS domain-containing protein [Pseudomonas fluorescens]MBD8816229.1 RHS domain-containing protein [Pseudomonas fluorescens]